MTTTTTALQALVEAADRIRIYAEGKASGEELDEFFLLLNDARIALAAPAPALDAPSELTLGPSGSADRYFYEAGFRAGARASQPTPAQDAAK